MAVRGPDGSVRGLVTASLPIAVRRGIDNEYLRDFDLLTGEDPRVEALYVDVREAEGAPAALPPLDPALRARDAVLTAPDGDSLARVRVVSPGLPEVREALTDRYRRALAVLAALALVAWAAGLGGGPAVVACAVAGWRLAWAAAGTPWPPADAAVRSAEVYASPLLGPLTRSPLDFLFTSLAVLVAVRSAFLIVRRRDPRTATAARRVGGIVAALAGPALAAAVVLDTVAHASLDLDAVTLAPATASHAALQLGLLAWALSGLIWAGLCAGARRIPAAPVPVARRRPAGCARGGGSGARRRDRGGARRLPHAAEPASSARARRAGGRPARPPPAGFPRVGARGDAEADRLAARPRGRSARAGIAPGIEELAFAVWSATDLAARGFSSAVEIQDATGAVISRFALNLPSLSAPRPAARQRAPGRRSREPAALASAERTGAARAPPARLRRASSTAPSTSTWPTTSGTCRSCDRRDPYSVLFRSAARARRADRPLALVVYGRQRDVVFSSVERPPAAAPGLLAPAARRRAGPLDDARGRRAARTTPTCSAGRDACYVLAYPRSGPGRYAADLVEAVGGLALVGAAGARCS